MSYRASTERWIAWVRLGGALFALVEVALFSPHPRTDYRPAEWSLAGAFLAGALVLLALAYAAKPTWLTPLGLAALLFDFAAVGAYGIVYAYEYGNQTRWALILVVVEAGLRYAFVGAVATAAAAIPYYALNEWWRAREFGGPGFIADRVTFPSGVTLLLGIIVGRLVLSLQREAFAGSERLSEAERLRDALGRRVDALEAANRSSRALASSLDLDQAFAAFIREVGGLVPFDRIAIVLVEGDQARTIATAGRGAGEVFPPGSAGPLEGSVLGRVVGGEVVVRADLADEEFPEDRQLVALGLHSELLVPLLLGPRPIGMLSLSRTAVDAFTQEEVELVALLGRLVASAVQNIRAYEAERSTVEELRRLSALRADFVSLVSHELRSPMAAVIGAARTLQERWRTLNPDQREAFLALIADETNRLAALIGDVLDTSRIEAGTFTYRFSDVDLGRLVSEAVGTAQVGQDEVRVRADVADRLPVVRGDRERLRQVVSNLIDNAVKYSPAGDEVAVRARPDNGRVLIEVRDHGPGIPLEQQRVIFEKFGRADVGGGSKPGTGLGLFIARSIAEAHGGSLDVRSRPDAGSTFVLSLPLPGAVPTP
ncbi:MAG TPA: ATP-binding protein [Gaiellaceae bacterium]|nr:ATP-binding protein [Gaiellaceae bacterium]